MITTLFLHQQCRISELWSSTAAVLSLPTAHRIPKNVKSTMIELQPGHIVTFVCVGSCRTGPFHNSRASGKQKRHTEAFAHPRHLETNSLPCYPNTIRPLQLTANTAILMLLHMMKTSLKLNAIENYSQGIKDEEQGTGKGKCGM